MRENVLVGPGQSECKRFVLGTSNVVRDHPPKLMICNFDFAWTASLWTCLVASTCTKLVKIEKKGNTSKHMGYSQKTTLQKRLQSLTVPCGFKEGRNVKKLKDDVLNKCASYILLV